jgi:hypothetical protein
LCFFLFIYIFGLNFNICFRQNIEADLGRVIAKISSQINPTTSAKVTKKKKEKKKEKKTSHNEPAEQKDKATQDIPVEAPSVEKPKDKKKQKKLKKAHSTSTTIVPEVSLLNEQPGGNPQGTNNDEPQGPSQEKISEHNNESSNSCLQPPPIKVFSKLFSYVKKILV